MFGRTPGWEASCFADTMLRTFYRFVDPQHRLRPRARSKVGMLSLQKPSADTLIRYLASQRGLPFTYKAVGATAETPPAGYVVDHTRIKLGEGEAVFRSACAALRRFWSALFRCSWFWLCSGLALIPGIS